MKTRGLGIRSETTLKLVECLMRKRRANTRELAAAAGIPSGEIAARLKQLIRRGVVRRVCEWNRHHVGVYEAVPEAARVQIENTARREGALPPSGNTRKTCECGRVKEPRSDGKLVCPFCSWVQAGFVFRNGQWVRPPDKARRVSPEMGKYAEKFCLQYHSHPSR